MVELWFITMFDYPDYTLNIGEKAQDRINLLHLNLPVQAPKGKIWKQKNTHTTLT